MRARASAWERWTHQTATEVFGWWPSVNSSSVCCKDNQHSRSANSYKALQSPPVQVWGGGGAPPPNCPFIFIIHLFFCHIVSKQMIVFYFLKVLGLLLVFELQAGIPSSPELRTVYLSIRWCGVGERGADGNTGNRSLLIRIRLGFGFRKPDQGSVSSGAITMATKTQWVIITVNVTYWIKLHLNLTELCSFKPNLSLICNDSFLNRFVVSEAKAASSCRPTKHNTRIWSLEG